MDHTPPLLRDLQILLADVAADRLASEARGRQQEGPGARERIDNQITRLGRVPDQSLRELVRLLPRVVAIAESAVGCVDVLHRELLRHDRAVQLGGDLLEECLANPDAAAPLGAYGVEIAALAGYRNLVAPDPAVREANIGALERCLELAPELGTPIVATETGTRHPDGDWTDTPENWTDDAWTLLYAALERLLPLADGSDFMILLARTSQPEDPKKKHQGLTAFFIKKKRGQLPDGCTGAPSGSSDTTCTWGAACRCAVRC